MMKSIIICEGATDFTLLQYFMRRVYGWNYYQASSFRPDIKDSISTDYIKNGNILTIVSAEGCANIKDVFSAVIRNNQNTVFDNERYSKIAIIADNDEEDSEEKIISELNELCGDSGEVQNRKWASLLFTDMTNNKQSFSMDLLLLLIPFDENGALETFLLNSISKQDSYDAEIIRKGNEFVESSDPLSKYLTHRGLKTKANFDVYFSIRTPAKQFRMR